MPPSFRTPEPYARLGVRPVINAQSWVTSLGGSLMRPEVLDAMNEAATCFVDMVELNRAAGEVVARACGAESGMVTAGASAAAMRRDGPAPETPPGRKPLPSIRPVTPRTPRSGSPRRAPACVGAVVMTLHR